MSADRVSRGFRAIIGRTINGRRETPCGYGGEAESARQICGCTLPRALLWTEGLRPEQLDSNPFETLVGFTEASLLE